MMANMVLAKMERNHHSLEDEVVKEMMALMENILMEEKEVKTTVMIMMVLVEVAQETAIPQAELDQKMINMENLTNGETADQNLVEAAAVMMAPMMEGVKDLLVQEVMNLDLETETKAHYLVSAEAHLLMMTPSMAKEKMVPAKEKMVPAEMEVAMMTNIPEEEMATTNLEKVPDMEIKMENMDQEKTAMMLENMQGSLLRTQMMAGMEEGLATEKMEQEEDLHQERTQIKNTERDKMETMMINMEENLLLGQMGIMMEKNLALEEMHQEEDLHQEEHQMTNMEREEMETMQTNMEENPLMALMGTMMEEVQVMEKMQQEEDFLMVLNPMTNMEKEELEMMQMHLEENHQLALMGKMKEKALAMERMEQEEDLHQEKIQMINLEREDMEMKQINMEESHLLVLMGKMKEKALAMEEREQEKDLLLEEILMTNLEREKMEMMQENTEGSLLMALKMTVMEKGQALEEMEEDEDPYLKKIQMVNMVKEEMRMPEMNMEESLLMGQMEIMMEKNLAMEEMPQEEGLHLEEHQMTNMEENLHMARMKTMIEEAQAMERMLQEEDFLMVLSPMTNMEKEELEMMQMHLEENPPMDQMATRMEKDLALEERDQEQDPLMELSQRTNTAKGVTAKVLETLMGMEIMLMAQVEAQTLVIVNMERDLLLLEKKVMVKAKDLKVMEGHQVKREEAVMMTKTEEAPSPVMEDHTADEEAWLVGMVRTRGHHLEVMAVMVKARTAPSMAKQAPEEDHHLMLTEKMGSMAKARMEQEKDLKVANMEREMTRAEKDLALEVEAMMAVAVMTMLTNLPTPQDMVMVEEETTRTLLEREEGHHLAEVEIMKMMITTKALMGMETKKVTPTRGETVIPHFWAKPHLMILMRNMVVQKTVTEEAHFSGEEIVPHSMEMTMTLMDPLMVEKTILEEMGHSQEARFLFMEDIQVMIVELAEKDLILMMIKMEEKDKVPNQVQADVEVMEDPLNLLILTEFPFLLELLVALVIVLRPMSRLQMETLKRQMSQTMEMEASVSHISPLRLDLTTLTSNTMVTMFKVLPTNSTLLL